MQASKGTDYVYDGFVNFPKIFFKNYFKFLKFYSI